MVLSLTTADLYTSRSFQLRAKQDVDSTKAMTRTPQMDLYFLDPVKQTARNAQVGSSGTILSIQRNPRSGELRRPSVKRHLYRDGSDAAQSCKNAGWDSSQSHPQALASCNSNKTVRPVGRTASALWWQRTPPVFLRQTVQTQFFCGCFFMTSNVKYIPDFEALPTSKYCQLLIGTPPQKQ